MRWRTKIFELAKARGWSDTQLARQLGVNQSTIWRQRSGTRAPSVKLVLAAARVFHQAPFDLWWEEVEAEPQAQPDPPPVALGAPTTVAV